MSKKVCITSYRSLGCTFVEWSIHFLSGQNKYYNVRQNKCIDLSQDPITKLNSHNHKKNHPEGLDSTMRYVDQIDQQSNNAIYSIYPFPLHVSSAAKQLEISVDQLCVPEQFTKIKKHIDDNYQKILDSCHERNIKLVFVSQDPRFILYHQFVRELDRFLTKPGKPESEEELKNHVQEIFFKNSISQWEELNLTNIWDVRERMALDIHPTSNVLFNANLSKPHHWVNCLDLWSNTDEVLKDIMKYLDLDIDPVRWQQWLIVCKKWQKIQLDIVKFCSVQPHIVEAIVNNWYYEIDLTFQQEVIIQHYLIYQHGLNLKTWQLTKFPSNTQDLHKLLEPNIHSVAKIY